MTNMDEQRLFDDTLMMGEGSTLDIGNNSMCFGSPPGGELNINERMTNDCPGFGVSGAEIGKKTTGLFGQADMVQSKLVAMLECCLTEIGVLRI